MKKMSFSRFSGFDRIRIAPTCAMASVRIVGRQHRALAGPVPEVALVERDVLDADDALVRLELGDAIDQQKRVPVGQNALDRGVVQWQLHRSCRVSIIPKSASAA